MVSTSTFWDLKSTNPKRTPGWTSADAAGMPIFPGLLRYEEAVTGIISHATRFVLPLAQKAYTYPGNHFDYSENPLYPPSGQRFRLKVCIRLEL